MSRNGFLTSQVEYLFHIYIICIYFIYSFFPFLGDDQSFEETIGYFSKRFIRLNHNEKKQVYTHCTDATDTTLLQHVMVAVSDIILNDNLNTLMV
jgi:guanine nucleotide-binding protein subunit alpha